MAKDNAVFEEGPTYVCPDCGKCLITLALGGTLVAKEVVCMACGHKVVPITMEKYERKRDSMPESGLNDEQGSKDLRNMLRAALKSGKRRKRRRRK